MQILDQAQVFLTETLGTGFLTGMMGGLLMAALLLIRFLIWFHNLFN